MVKPPQPRREQPTVHTWQHKAAKGEGWAPPSISCAQDAVGLTPTGPTAIRLGKPLPSYNVTTLYVLFLFQNTPTCHSYSSLCHLAYNITEKGSSQIFHSYSQICKCPDDLKCPTDWSDMSNSLVKAFKNAGNFNMLLESIPISKFISQTTLNES